LRGGGPLAGDRPGCGQSGRAVLGRLEFELRDNPDMTRKLASFGEDASYMLRSISSA
jgi:hypothetical protein